MSKKRGIKKNARAMFDGAHRRFMLKDLPPNLPRGQLVIARKVSGQLFVLWPFEMRGVRLADGVDVEPAYTVKEAITMFGPAHGIYEPPAYATVLYWISHKLIRATKDSLSLGRGGAWYIPKSAIDGFHAPKRGAPFQALRK